MNPRTVSLIKKVSVSTFVLAVLLLAGSLLLDGVRSNQDLRAKAGGSKMSNATFCKGKEMCDDGRCVGETWRECRPCPPGNARTVYRVSCEDDVYSDCIVPADNCVDQ